MDGERVEPARAAAVTLVLLGWVGAAVVLGAGLFTMTFLDDCNRPACNVPRGVHAFYVGTALTVVVAYAAAWWAMRDTGRGAGQGSGRGSRQGPGRRWPRALLALVVCLGCAAVTMFGVYRALDLHPDEFQRQQLR